MLSTEAPVGQGTETSESGGVSVLTEGAGSGYGAADLVSCRLRPVQRDCLPLPRRVREWKVVETKRVMAWPACVSLQAQKPSLVQGDDHSARVDLRAIAVRRP